MKKVFVLAAAIALLCLGTLAQANITMDTVPVGNPGNTADTAAHSGNSNGQGSVAYTYSIGKYEVTASQYTDFLNKVAATDTYGLYNTYMGDPTNYLGCNIQRSGSSGSYTYSVASDWANRPVNYVSYWDSCRFANWLHNGQPTGLQSALTTEDGAYYINGYSDIDGRAIERKAGWKWAVTSEDEWYKAAYYKGGSTSAGYWDYPTRSNTAPANQVLPTDPGNSANYYISNYSIGSPYYRTNVGEFENSASPYGTFDQGGNVFEWNEAIVYQGAYRGIRGGSFDNSNGGLQASSRNRYTPTVECSSVGFRVSEAVPEPSSLIVLGGGVLALAGMIRRRR
jgi:sulfatase modifying factor 1